MCTNSKTNYTNGLEECVGRVQRRLFLGRQVKGNLGDVVQIRVCRFYVNMMLTLSINYWNSK